MYSIIKKSIDDSIKLQKTILANNNILLNIENAIEISINSLKSNNKILIAGNGGSASDAQHFAAELVGRFFLNRKALPAIALTTDTSIITAVANDFGFEQIFKKQIEGLAKENDIFYAISTSGNSANLLQAINLCKEKNVKVIGLTGRDGGLMNDLCDINICVPAMDTPRIQESHALIIHIICEIIEKRIFS
jgi:D-sedoheptulose 7-phosphate isomerase